MSHVPPESIRHGAEACTGKCSGILFANECIEIIKEIKPFKGAAPICWLMNRMTSNQ